MHINKNNLFIRGWLLLSVLSFAIFGSLSGVVAQNNSTSNSGNGFKISPVRYEFAVEKGKSQTVDIRVENPTKIRITASVIINDFGPPENETGEPKIYYDPDTSAPGNSFKSIAKTPQSVTIEPDGVVDVPVTISVPLDASAGGYYGAVRVVPDNPQGDNINLAASVGTLFLVEVPGELTENLQLVDFTAAKNGSNGRFFINSGAMSAVTRLRNDGNIHVKPFGKITVTDRSGKVIQQIEFNDTDPKANVLPNSTRKFTNDLAPRNWLGKYTLTANLGYGTSGSLITAKASFWVIPLWLVLVSAGVLIAIIVAAYLLYKRYVNAKHRHRVHHRR